VTKLFTEEYVQVSDDGDEAPRLDPSKLTDESCEVGVAYARVDWLLTFAQVTTADLIKQIEDIKPGHRVPGMSEDSSRPLMRLDLASLVVKR
jgi:hypothetical protein